MKIVMVPVKGAVGWFRATGPGHYLVERGHEVVILGAEALTPEQQLEHVVSADVVHVVGPCEPIEKAPGIAARRGALVVDMDDDWWAWLDDPARAVAPAEVNEERARLCEEWLRAADLVTTTTAALGDVLRAHGARDVAVVANALGPEAQRQSLPRKRSAVLDRIGLEQRPRVVGWTGSIVHRWDLPPVLKALRRIEEADALVEVRSLGPANFAVAPEWHEPPSWKPRYMPMLWKTKDGRFEWHTPWPHYFDVLEAMAADVAVVPLRPSPLNLSKSAITPFSWGIQAVPVVCSRTGPYAEAEAAGFPAVYVEHEDTEAWTREVRDLLYEPLRARALGEKARRWVLEHAAFPEAADAWVQAFARAIARREEVR